MRQRQCHIFFSIKPKLDKWLFVDFCVLPRFYLNLPDLNLKFFCLMFRTILGSDQVNSGKNRVIHRNQQTIAWQVLSFLVFIALGLLLLLNHTFLCGNSFFCALFLDNLFWWPLNIPGMNYNEYISNSNYFAVCTHK